MEDRLQQLEKTVGEILERLQRLETRLDARSEGRPPVARQPVAATSSGAGDPLPGAILGRLLQLVGRSCLVLGGAFLIRALSDGRVLSLGVGITFALLLAAASVAFAYRSGGLSSRLSATFHGVTAALIAYSLAVEASTRLGAISGSTAAMVIAGTTAALLVAAWRHRLAALAWVTVAFCLASTLALMQATGAMGELTLILLLVTASTLWLAQARRWNGPRWLAALVLDAAVMRIVLSAAYGGAAARGQLFTGFIFSLGVVLLTLTALAHRTFSEDNRITAFHVVQTLFGTTVGVTAVVCVSAAYGWSTAPAGALAIATAALALVIALAMARRRGPGSVDHLFYLALSAGLLFVGGALATSYPMRGLLWAAIGLGAASLGRRMNRTSLFGYGAVFLWAGAAGSSLLGAVADGLLASAGPWRSPGPTALMVFGLVLGGYLVSASLAADRGWVARLPASAILFLCASSSAALAVHAERAALGSWADDAGLLATARTVSLVAVAALLAMSSRSTRKPELAWVAYLLLGIVAIKLLAEDLPHGRALTLLIGFVAYGIGLLGIQKLIRPPRDIAPPAAQPAGGEKGPGAPATRPGLTVDPAPDGLSGRD